MQGASLRNRWFDAASHDSYEIGGPLAASDIYARAYLSVQLRGHH